MRLNKLWLQRSLLVGISFMATSSLLNYCPSKNLEQETQEGINVSDSTKSLIGYERFLYNYEFEKRKVLDSLYKELGIDKAKYTQEELDSMVDEAIRTIL